MKTTTRMLKKLLLFSAVFLTSNQLIAQTNTSITQTVCAGSSAEPYLINPPTTGSTYQWTLVNGNGTITSGQGTNSILIDWGSTAGVDTLKVLEINNGCNATEVKLTVTIVDAPTSNAGVDDAICAGDTYTLGASSTNGSGLWSGGSGTYNPNNTVANAIYTPSSADTVAGIVTLTWTVTGNGSPGSACYQDVDIMVLTINLSPASNAGVDDAICAGDTYTLGASSTNGSGSWSGGSGTYNPNNTVANAIYTPSSADTVAGTVTLTWTVTGSGSSGSACYQDIDNMVLTINASPTSNAGVDTTLCQGEIYTLSGTATNGTSILWTHNGSGTITGAATATPIYTPDPTDVTVTLTMTVTGNAPCLNATSSMVITINPNPTPGPIWHN